MPRLAQPGSGLPRAVSPEDCRAVAAVPASSPAYGRRAKPDSHACGVRAGGPGQHQPMEVGQGNMARCHVSREAAQLRRLNGRGNPLPPMDRQSASSVDRQAWRPVATGSPNPAQPMRPRLRQRRTVSMIVPSRRAEERKQDQRAILIHEHSCDCRPGHAPCPRSDRAPALSIDRPGGLSLRAAAGRASAAPSRPAHPLHGSCASFARAWAAPSRQTSDRASCLA
jgi:hypothetical protein